MKQFASALFALGLAAGVAPFTAEATDYTWLPTAANTEATAYEWDSADNWKDGNVPKGADVSCTMLGAVFTSDSAGDQYIKFPDGGLTLGDLDTKGGSKHAIYFVGGKLTLTKTSGTSSLSGSWNTGKYPYFHTPVDVTGNLSFSEQFRGKICNTFAVSGTLVFNNCFDMRLTTVATATGIRTNAFPTGNYTGSGSNPVLNLFSDDDARYRQEIALLKCDSNVSLQTRIANVQNATDLGDTGAMIDVDIAKITGSATLSLGMDGYYDQLCGRVFLHDTSGFTGGITAQQARLFLYRNGDGSDPTIAAVTLLNNQYVGIRTRLCVPESGVTATIGSLAYPDPMATKYVSEFVKLGAGRLVISECTLGTRAHFVVKAGTLCFGGTTKTVDLPYLTVADGATIEIPEGVTLNVGEATMNGTVTVKGPGTLNVTAYSSTTAITKLVYAGGANYAPGYNETDVARMQTVAEVRGTPALWLDANDLAAGTTDVHGETTAGGYVVRWTDTRATTGLEGYISATNGNTTTAYRPTLQTANDDAAGRCVKMDRNFSSTGYGSIASMFWTVPLTNITHVFAVADPVLGGGHFLGATTRLVELGVVANDPAKVPFYRGHWDWNDNGNFADVSNVWAPVKNGTWRNNGLKVTPTAATAWGSLTAGGRLIEFHPAGTVPADSFAADVNATGGNGRSIYHEVLIYTNELSDLDCRCVAAYLMKKWLEASYVRSDDVTFFPRQIEGNGTVSVDTGVSLGVEEWAADGTVGKSGAGTLQIDLLQVPAGGVSVTEGALTVANNAFTSEDEFPEGVAYHLDATRAATTFDVYKTAGGTNFYGRLRDVRGTAVAPFECRSRSSSLSYFPFLRENALNGLPAVDFGPLWPLQGEYDAWKRVLLQFMKAPTTTYGNDNGAAAIEDVTATFQIFGSEYGGNTIFGGPTIGGNDIAPRTTTSPTAAVVNSRSCTMASAGRFSLNGTEYADPTTAYLSGAFDLVAWRQKGSEASGVDIAALAFSAHSALGSAGQLLGEVIIYTNAITKAEYGRIQSYLNKKWFGDYIEGFRPSTLSAVRVAAGASFAVDGNGVTVATVGGAGTVTAGDLLLADGGVVELTVDGDGTLAPLTVGADASLRALGGGTVRLTGSVPKLRPGSSAVILGNATFENGSSWTLENAPGRRPCTLAVENGILVLTASRSGLAVSVF